MQTSTTPITELLAAFNDGNREAMERLLPLLYDDLRRLAHFQLRRWQAGQTLDTTSLVHEAYLKLIDREGSSWRDRGHFLAATAQAMRHILVDAARSRLTAKRGAGQTPITLNDDGFADEQDHAFQVLMIDQALEQLKDIDPRICRVVECRVFAGLTEKETGEALGISARTAHRDWLRARGWLRRHLDLQKTACA